MSETFFLHKRNSDLKLSRAFSASFLAYVINYNYYQNTECPGPVMDHSILLPFLDKKGKAIALMYLVVQTQMKIALSKSNLHSSNKFKREEFREKLCVSAKLSYWKAHAEYCRIAERVQ